jgi:hypothetical protein
LNGIPKDSEETKRTGKPALMHVTGI